MIVTETPQISVVVTSFQRRALLLECLERLHRQTLRLEVVVVDDGSTDGSVEAVARDWPAVRVIANDTGIPRLPAVQRDLGYGACRCAIAASIDEDLHLDAPDSLSRWLEGFDDPRVAIVGIPFRDVEIDARIQQAAPDGARLWQRHTHIACGALVDLGWYRAVGGYARWIGMHREEDELALRLLAAGGVVRVLPPERVAAHRRRASGLRAGLHRLAARNDLLIYWRFTPLVLLLPFLLLTALRSLVDGWRAGAVGPRLRGLLDAPVHGWRHALGRQPVSLQSFLRFRALKGRGPLPLDPPSPMSAATEPRHVHAA